MQPSITQRPPVNQERHTIARLGSNCDGCRFLAPCFSSERWEPSKASRQRSLPHTIEPAATGASSSLLGNGVRGDRFGGLIDPVMPSALFVDSRPAQRERLSTARDAQARAPWISGPCVAIVAVESGEGTRRPRNLRGQRLPLHVDAVSGIGDAVGVPPARRCSESREYGLLQLTEEERVRVRDAHAIHSVELVKRLDAGARPQLLRCPIGSVGPTGDS